jgi:hypothetical protein
MFKPVPPNAAGAGQYGRGRSGDESAFTAGRCYGASHEASRQSTGEFWIECTRFDTTNIYHLISLDGGM